MSCTHNCNQGRDCACPGSARIIAADGLTVVETDVEFELVWSDLAAIVLAVAVVAYLIL